MLDKVISVVITFVVSGALGYCVKVIENYKKKVENYKDANETQNEAIKCLLRANIVNQYYVYKQIGKIPFYVKESLHKEFEAYKGLNGNSFVEDIMKEIDTWEVI